MKFLATLILNWNEDGKIYRERLQEKEDAPPPLNLNPWIRGFRLAFVLLFVAFDVGMIIYNKVSYDLINIFKGNLGCYVAANLGKDISNCRTKTKGLDF